MIEGKRRKAVAREIGKIMKCSVNETIAGSRGS